MLNFLVARLSLSPTCIRKNRAGFLHRNASHIFNSFSSAVKSSESDHPNQNQQGNESFTVSYLINSCCLSPKSAIQASKKITLKDPGRPNMVLDLFRSYGFSETQISKVVKTRPQSLLANPGTTILPKLRFFQSIGFSCSEIAELILSNPALLSRSLEKFLIPVYEALKSVTNGDDEMVVTAIKHSGSRFHCLHIQDFVANLKFLRENGVPQSSVSMMISRFANAAFTKHARFVESVEFAKEIGIEPVKATFILAVFVMASTKKSTWKSKLDIFERCGMPRDITLLAFRNYPICMLESEKKIMNSMKFLLNEMGLPPKDIARSASLLGYSLETRMIPRWSVFRFLRDKGLIKRDMSFYSIVKISEKKFLEKFVFSFEESVPQILSIYKGQLGTLPEVSPI